MDAVLQRLEKVASRMERIAVGTLGIDDTADGPKLFSDGLLVKQIPDFTAACHALNSNELSEVALCVRSIFVSSLAIINQFRRFRSPSDKGVEKDCLTQLGTLLTDHISAIDKIRNEVPRDHAFFNHLSAVSESISAVGWFACTEPVTYVHEMVRASEFYMNRISAQHKNESAKHNVFMQAWLAVLNGLLEFVRENYPVGATWNASAGSECTVESLRLAVTSGKLHDDEAASAQKQASMDSLREHLNKGIELANKGQLTPGSDAKSSTSSRTPAASENSTKTKQNADQAATKNRDSSAEQKASVKLQGNRWFVENGHNQSKIDITITDMKQSVYVYNCSRSLIRLAGTKMNALSLDKCHKVDVLIEQPVLSTFECVNCKQLKVQALDVVPTIAVDKTDGCQLILSSKADCSVYTSLSSEVTLLTKDPVDDASDFIETSVPYQVVTSYSASKGTVENAIATNLTASS